MPACTSSLEAGGSRERAGEREVNRKQKMKVVGGSSDPRGANTCTEEDGVSSVDHFCSSCTTDHHRSLGDLGAFLLVFSVYPAQLEASYTGRVEGRVGIQPGAGSGLSQRVQLAFQAPEEVCQAWREAAETMK